MARAFSRGKDLANILDMGWEEYREFLRTEARKTGTPAFGTFELTPLCNFNCKMCYVHLSLERMRELGRLRTADEWVDMAHQAREMGTVWITLTGGEVLTRPDFAEIYSRISDLGMMVSVLSNGSLINDEIVELFLERRPTYLRFTLYGSSNETYERLCGVSDGFDRVMRGLHKLSDAGIDFNLAFTETRLNIDDFEGAQSIADEFGTSVLVGANLVSGVRGASNETDSLQVEKPVLPRARREAKPIQESGKQAVFRNAEVAPQEGPFSRCKSYRNSFWLDWNGNMELCAFMSSCGIKPFEVGMKKAWSELLERLARIRRPEKCMTCAFERYCLSCPGTREAETGSAERVVEQYCNQAYAIHSACRR